MRPKTTPRLLELISKGHLFFHKGGRGKTGLEGKFGKSDPNSDKQFAVRSGKWRLVGPTSLYEIENDPAEEINLFEQHPDVIKALQKSDLEFWKTAHLLMIKEDAARDVEPEKNTRSMPREDLSPSATQSEQ